MLKTSLFSQTLAKPLHILFACSWYPHRGNPGNGIFIKRHAECLATQHKVTVVFVKSSDLVTETETTVTESGGLREVICLYPKVKSNIHLLGTFFKLKAYREHFLKTIGQAVEKQPVDLVNLQVIFPAAIPLLSWLKQQPRPFVITEHWSGYYPEDGHYKGFYMKQVTRRIVSKAKALLVISAKLKQSMLAQGLKGNYHLIGNAVDTAVFRPLTVNRKHDRLRILHVSSLVECEKNISGIFAIAEQLKQAGKLFSLTMVGGMAADVEHYKALVSEKNLSADITFFGLQTPTEVAQHMNEADVFLLFSHYEGMPVVLLEAMACGLPVISTNVGAVPAMVDPKKGIVLPDHLPASCVRALLEFDRGHFEEAAAMHDAIAAVYGYEAVCRQITSVYERALQPC